MKFKSEQLEAINTTDINLTVSASAGAGKTTVLVARLMKRILDDGLSVKDILAMTFTEKAASEMKKRLQQELYKSYQSNDSPRLKKELVYLQDAQISTIHSFCLSIVKEFGYLIGLDPRRVSVILNDSQTLNLTDEALDTIINNKMKDPSLQVVEEFFNYLNARVFTYQELKELVEKLSSSSMVHLHPKEWLQSIQSNYLANSFVDLPNEIQKVILISYLDTTKSLISALEDFHFELTVQEKVNSTFVEIINQQIVFAKQLLAAIEEKNFESIKMLSETILRLTYPKLSKAHLELKETKSIVESLLKSETMTMMLLGDTTETTSKTLKLYVDLLVELTLSFQEEFENLKVKHQGMTFDDIEHFAYAILVHPSGVAKEALKQRYQEIMVDEFQDSNFFQNEIVNLISRGNNVFRVGDIKQSIYKFRHARPSLMRDIMKIRDKSHQTLFLSNNFRSTKNIVDFSNHIFKYAMNTDGIPDSYSSQDTVTIGDEARQNKVDQPKVSIALIDSKQPVQQLIFGELTEIKQTKDEKLSSYIAQDILRKVESKQYRYNDIAILTKGHKRKKSLKKLFDLYDIPYYFDDREGFYNSDVVSDLSHFIEFILHPNDDSHLLWVLMSKFFLLSENDLSLIRLHNTKQPLYVNLPFVFSDVYQTLEYVKQLYSELSPLDFVIELTKINDYYEERCNVQQKTNIDLYISLLEDYVQQTNSGLSGFIDMIENAKKLETSSAAAQSEEADVVRVLTIHASKGLQFPLVYLFSQDRIVLPDISQKVLIDSDWGVSIYDIDHEAQLYQNNLLRFAFKQKIKLEEASENLRLLYVALTRPQNELIVVDYNGKFQEQLTLESLLSGKVFTSVIMSVLNKYPTDTCNVIYPVVDDLPALKIAIKSQHLSPIINQKLYNMIDLQTDETGVNLSLIDSFSQKERGRLLHSIIETVDKGEFIADNYDIDFNDREVLHSYFNHSFTKELYKHPLYHEAAIAYETEESLVYGYVDMISESKDRVVIVDFKSDNVNDGEQLINRYKIQLTKYAEGLRKVYEDTLVEVYLYSFKLNEYFKVNL